MLPQPPASVDVPPVSKAARRSLGWWILGFASSGMLLLAIWLSSPVVIRSRKGSSLTDAVSNARQIGLALHRFDVEYGRFPDETTIDRVRQKTGTAMSLGSKSSNDFFRQLLATGMAGNEGMFHAGAAGAREGDEVTTGTRALERGEVSFAYVSGLDPAGNPAQPVLLAPMIPGTDRFDPGPFHGKAVIVRLDNSVTTLNIGKNGKVILSGKSLLDPANPVWSGKAWRLVLPE